MSSEFGSATGNVLSIDDADSARADMVMFRVLFAVANALRQHDNPLQSDTWHEVQTKMYGEQLAVIAALTVGATIVYGDRPKALTYKRLLGCCSAADLDHAFGCRSARNFRELLGHHISENDVPSGDVETVLMAEREAVLCHSASMAAESACDADGTVVVLVGEAHVPAMQKMLSAQSWQDVVGKGGSKPAGPFTDPSAWHDSPWGEPPTAASTLPDYGLRRALAEAVMSLRVTGSVLSDMARTLGPVPEEHEAVYEAVSETYGTCRMLLAPLDRELLHEVVGGCACDFYEVLEPLRRIRPVNGGAGWDEALLVELRELNFDLG